MATPLEQAQARLTEIRTAISDVLTGGQSVGVNARELRRASLKDLREMEKEARAEVSRLTRGGGSRVYRIIPK